MQRIADERWEWERIPAIQSAVPSHYGIYQTRRHYFYQYDLFVLLCLSIISTRPAPVTVTEAGGRMAGILTILIVDVVSRIRCRPYALRSSWLFGTQLYGISLSACGSILNFLMFTYNRSGGTPEPWLGALCYLLFAGCLLLFIIFVYCFAAWLRLNVRPRRFITGSSVTSPSAINLRRVVSGHLGVPPVPVSTRTSPSASAGVNQKGRTLVVLNPVPSEQLLEMYHSPLVTGTSAAASQTDTPSTSAVRYLGRRTSGVAAPAAASALQSGPLSPTPTSTPGLYTASQSRRTKI
jgi:hypothetical protein